MSREALPCKVPGCWQLARYPGSQLCNSCYVSLTRLRDLATTEFMHRVKRYERLNNRLLTFGRGVSKRPGGKRR